MDPGGPGDTSLFDPFKLLRFFEWIWNGQTPGKRWLKLRVIREDGRPVTFWEAAVRNLLRAVDMMPAPFYSIGLISVFVSMSDQRVGDVVAGTVVVREREAEAPAFAQVFASPVSDPALRRSFQPVDFVAELNVLTESEIEVVETFCGAAGIWPTWRGSGWPGGSRYHFSTSSDPHTTWPRSPTKGSWRNCYIDIAPSTGLLND